MFTRAPRWLLAIGLLIASVVVIGGAAVAYTSASVHFARAEDEVQTRADIQGRAGHMTATIGAAMHDVRIVARLPRTSRTLVDRKRADAAEVETWLQLVARLQPNYLQIRLIGADGREVVRIDRDGDDARVVPAQALQDKDSRYYVKETLRQPAGGVYLSPIDLNVEHGAIEEPWRPVLRVGTPVIGDEDSIVGMVIVNLDATYLLSIAADDGPATGQRLVVNDDGYILAGNPAEASWGFMFGRPAAFPQQHRAAWSHLHDGTTGQFQSGRLLYTSATISPAAGSAGQPGGDDTPWRLHLLNVHQVLRATDLWVEPSVLAIAAVLLAGLAWASWHGAGVLHARNEALRGKLVAENTANRLESVMNTAVDGLIVIDSHGCMQSFNRACERIFGYAATDVIGRNVAMLMPQPYRGEHDGYLAAYRAGGAPKIIGVGREVAGRRRSGEEFPLELAVGEFDDGNGKSYVGVVRDISERKAMEAEMDAQRQDLLRSNADLEQFAYVVSHDLKSPLRGIGSVAGWLREDLADVLDEDQMRSLGLIDQRVQRMAALLDGILAYSRASREPHALEKIDPAAVIEEIRTLGLVPDRFRFEVGANMPVLVGEYAQFRQVLQNLIVNAVKHHDRDRGVITVRAQVRAGIGQFEVEDDGPGIPERHRTRIFRIFEKLSPKDEGDSSGIGLALVKKLVERNGGRIDVHPPGAGAGRGTVFAFDWPLHMADEMEDLSNVA